MRQRVVRRDPRDYLAFAQQAGYHPAGERQVSRCLRPASCATLGMVLTVTGNTRNAGMTLNRVLRYA